MCDGERGTGVQLIDTVTFIGSGGALCSWNVHDGTTMPPARGSAGTLGLLVAQLAAVCADSARAVAGSSLIVRVWTEADYNVVTIADNGAGNPRAFEVAEVVREILAPWGASLDALSDEGRGCAFELRLVTQVESASQ